RRPVTPEVAGSSPVARAQTAANRRPAASSTPACAFALCRGFFLAVLGFRSSERERLRRSVLRLLGGLGACGGGSSELRGPCSLASTGGRANAAGPLRPPSASMGRPGP